MTTAIEPPTSSDEPDMPPDRMIIWCPADRSLGIQTSFGEDMERDEAVQLLLHVVQQLMRVTTLHPDDTP